MSKLKTNSHKSKIVTLILVLVVGGYYLFFAGDKKLENLQNTINSRETISADLFEVGDVAPDIEMIGFDGEVFKLSDFEGKGILLDFWATWCPFCTEEMPELQKIHEEFGEEVVIVGIHRTDTESISKGKKFAEEMGVNYPLVSDKNGSLYKSSGGFGMPVAVFINDKGVVTEIKSGPKTAQEIGQKARGLK